MAKDVFDTSTAMELRDAWNGVLLNSARFNWKVYEAFTEAYTVYLNILFEESDSSKDLAEFEKDFSLDDTLLSVWTKGMDVDTLSNAFGNVPSTLLNEALALRNPVEYSHKYPHFFEQRHSLESIIEFIATQTWLYDSPPVIGEIYREFVKYCYQQNLFIRNKMNVHGAIVNLRDVSMPFPNVVAQRDDLVASRSSIALNNAVGSIESGHVGLLIGLRAHKEVWPKVGDWLRERS